MRLAAADELERDVDEPPHRGSDEARAALRPLVPLPIGAKDPTQRHLTGQADTIARCSWAQAPLVDRQTPQHLVRFGTIAVLDVVLVLVDLLVVRRRSTSVLLPDHRLPVEGLVHVGMRLSVGGVGVSLHIARLGDLMFQENEGASVAEFVKVIGASGR